MAGFEDAERFADVLAKMLDTLGVGKTYVSDGYSSNYYRPDFADVLMRPEQAGAPPGYDPRRIGRVLDKPLWGGVKMPIPMTGIGYEKGDWMRANGLGNTFDSNYLKADPFQQMVYGYLIQKGYPLFGPSYKSYMDELYGPGSEGLVGFGEK